MRFDGVPAGNKMAAAEGLGDGVVPSVISAGGLCKGDALA